jgi:hypothetical protein
MFKEIVRFCEKNAVNVVATGAKMDCINSTNVSRDDYIDLNTRSTKLQHMACIQKIEYTLLKTSPKSQNHSNSITSKAKTNSPGTIRTSVYRASFRLKDERNCGRCVSSWQGFVRDWCGSPYILTTELLRTFLVSGKGSFIVYVCWRR